MKLHRYYTEDTELKHDFWLQDERLFHQWTRVLRYEVGREVVLFNNRQEVKLYKISKIGNDAVHLELVTEMEPTLPKKDVYLCFSLLKKDKNEWILQKGTELGVRHFIPLIADRTEKTGFDIERAEKIIVEAAEQCGRVDVPRVREPIHVAKAVEELSEKIELYVAEQGSPQLSNINYQISQPLAVLIGPEGGWSDNERRFFDEKHIPHYSLSNLTLRAETAAIAAAAMLA